MELTPTQIAILAEIDALRHGTVTIYKQDGKVTRVEPKTSLNIDDLLSKHLEKALTNQAIKSKI